MPKSGNKSNNWSMAKKLKIAVLMGGPSTEYEVSLNTGKNVLANLERGIYDPEPIVISKEEKWDIPPEELRDRTDVAFLATHGNYGEDGTLQGELDVAGVPYTCSDARSSALAMNKFLSLQLLRDAGFTVPPTILLSKTEWLVNPELLVKKIEWFVNPPYVLKPNRGGSSVGVFVVRNASELQNVLSQLFDSYGEIIVQPYIEGREVTCGVLDFGMPGTAYPLPPTEIIPNLGQFFDYNSKYKTGGADEITPARLADSWLKEIQRAAKEAHLLFGCRGMSRTDMILGKDNKLYILEINTIPGLTKTSLVPKAAMAIGISFPELINRIIRASLNSYN